jgi:beta-barrel assembly-enhancing protease
MSVSHALAVRGRLVAAALFFLAAALGGCGSFNLVSLDEEWQFGQQIERELATQLTLSRDQVLNQYVNQVGQQIVRQTGLAGRPWRFYVVQDPQVNAFNTPGGLVYVNTGLIAAAGNASELAGVIAHEVAHGAQRHGTRRLSQAYGANVIAGILLGQNPGIVQQIVAQIVAGGTFAQFSRSDEREADRYGVRFMHAAGYNPDGMVTMFQRILDQRQRQPGSVERFFSTHPLTEDRIRETQAEIRNLPRRANLITDEQAFRNAKARIR